MNLDTEELNYTKNQKLVKAIRRLENREDYLVPNSDLDNAIEIVLEYVKGKLKQ